MLVFVWPPLPANTAFSVRLMLVAPETFHSSFADPTITAIVDGLTVNLLITGNPVVDGAPVTVTVAVSVAVPAELVAVSVYTVVAVTETWSLSIAPSGCITLNPGAVSDIVLAPVISQDRVTEFNKLPQVMFDGLAVK